MAKQNKVVAKKSKEEPNLKPEVIMQMVVDRLNPLVATGHFVGWEIATIDGVRVICLNIAPPDGVTIDVQDGNPIVNGVVIE